MTLIKKYLRNKDEVKKRSLLTRIDKHVLDNLDEIDVRLSAFGMSKIPRSEVVEDALRQFAKKMELELKNFPESDKQEKWELENRMDRDREDR